jgi:hypothetical protein
MSQRHPTALGILDELCRNLSRKGCGNKAWFYTSSTKLPKSLSCFKGLLGIRKEESVQGTCHPKNRPKVSKGAYWTIEGESAFEAAFLGRAMLEVIFDSAPQLLGLPVEEMLEIYLVARSWPQGRFQKFAKYVTAYPMAAFMRVRNPMNDLPEVPAGFKGSPLVFKGRVKKFLANRLYRARSQTGKNARLWQGYLNGVKRGCAPMTESDVHAQMISHRQTLSEEPPLVNEEICKPWLERLSKTFPDPIPKLYEVTTSASWEALRSEGGARSVIRPQFQDELLAMVEVKPGVVEEARGYPLPIMSEVIEEELFDTELVTGEDGSLSLLRTPKEEKPLDTMVSAVLEPLKVRLITKANSVRSWLSRFMQKSLWRFLVKIPGLSLIGKPLEVQDLHDLLKREHDLGIPDFDQWVSGDYSAATDNLNIRFTKMAFESFLEKCSFSEDLKKILRSILYEQTLNYPLRQNKDHDLDPVLQGTGQLMGSILSFPILCVVNLVTYWAALEDYMSFLTKSEWTCSVEELPVLINGDDILFRANSEFYGVWQEWLRYSGFTLSLGKNYINPTFFTINSQLYQFHHDLDGTENLKFLGMFNTGLLTGQSKVTGGKNQAALPLWDIYNTVLDGAVSKSRAHRRFIHYNLKVIKEMTHDGLYNLFLPHERGGLGFVKRPEVRNHLTSFQRRFASLLEARFFERVSEGNVDVEKITLTMKDRISSSGPVRQHRSKLVVLPAVGPSQVRTRDVPPIDEYKPPLAYALLPMKPEMAFRMPKKAMREYIRTAKDLSGQWSRAPVRIAQMNNALIYDWPFRLEESLFDDSDQDPGVASIQEAKTVESSSHLNISVLSCPADGNLADHWFGPIDMSAYWA